MTNDLTDNLNRYFAAQNDQDVDAMAAAFATNAEVLDEGHTYVGREAIREWKAATSAKYGVTVQPLSVAPSGDVVRVLGRVAGQFPGSPIELTYEFVLDDEGLIRSLKIH